MVSNSFQKLSADLAQVDKVLKKDWFQKGDLGLKSNETDFIACKLQRRKPACSPVKSGQNHKNLRS